MTMAGFDPLTLFIHAFICRERLVGSPSYWGGSQWSHCLSAWQRWGKRTLWVYLLVLGGVLATSNFFLTVTFLCSSGLVRLLHLQEAQRRPEPLHPCYDVVCKTKKKIFNNLLSQTSTPLAPGNYFRGSFFATHLFCQYFSSCEINTELYVLFARFRCSSVVAPLSPRSFECGGRPPAWSMIPTLYMWLLTSR